MQRRDRLPHSLDQAVVIRERAVLFGVRRGRKNNVSGSSGFVLEEFLNHEKVEVRERICASFEMFGQEAARKIERANRITCAVEKLSRRHKRVHHAHIVCADAVVEERQWMKQEATSFARKRSRELRDDGLSFTTKFVTNHHNYIARCVCDRLSRGINFTRFDTGFLCSECVIRRVSQRQHDRVFSSRSNVQEHLRLLAQTNRR